MTFFDYLFYGEFLRACLRARKFRNQVKEIKVKLIVYNINKKGIEIICIKLRISTEPIKVRSEIGTNMAVEDEVVFVQNESALLMLKDENIGKQLFRVPLGLKYSVSDRNTVIQELKAQGKLQGENQTGNETNDTGMVENTETISDQKGNITENKTVDYGKDENTGVDKQKGVGSTIESKRVPFISPIWVLATLLGAIPYVKRK